MGFSLSLRGYFRLGLPLLTYGVSCMDSLMSILDHVHLDFMLSLRGPL